MPRKTDEGYAWVVLAACFAIQVITDGVAKSFGLFYVEIVKKFEEKVFITTLITGIMNGVFCLSSLPIMMYLIKSVQPRFVVMIGCLLTACGYSLSCLADHMYLLFFTLSLLVGGGTAMLFPPSIYILGTYFNKRRSMANGIAISGGCIGGLLCPFFYRFLLDVYGVQGALFLVGAILLHNLPLALLLRPISKIMTASYKNYDSELYERDSSYVSNGKISVDLTGNGKTGEDDPFLGEREICCSNQEQPSVDKTSSFTSNLTANDNKFKQSSSPENIKGRMSTSPCAPMLNPTFVLFIFANSLSSVVVGTFISFLPLFANHNGIEKEDIVILVSIAAASDFVGRIFSGIVADRPQIKTAHVLAFSQMACGIAFFCNFFLTSFTPLILFSIVVGMFSGVQLPLMYTHAIEIVGLKMSSNAFSIIIVGQLPAFILGPFVFGLLRDVTGSYSASYYFVGGVALASSMLFLSEPITDRFVDRSLQIEHTDLDVK